MKYYTAIEAARTIGVSEKTIRNWIQQGKIQTRHPDGIKNKLAIPETELAKYLPETTVDVSPALSALTGKVAQLEEQLSKLGARLAILEHLVQQQPEHTETQATRPQKQATEDTEVYRPSHKQPLPEHAEDIPEGAILARNFAKMHNVNPRTFTDQIDKGIHGERIDALIRAKPGRAHETERWLTW